MTGRPERYSRSAAASGLPDLTGDRNLAIDTGAEKSGDVHAAPFNGAAALPITYRYVTV